MTNQAGEQEERVVVPVSFRLSTYWKLERHQTGFTNVSSVRISLSEVLDLLLGQLTDDEAAVETKGSVTRITIDWPKVPHMIRDPFSYGVKR